MRDNLIFLLLNSVPKWLRGRLYLRICRRQMERWHPELRTDPSWRSRFTD
ncbi:hypothetical protein AB0C02_28050 [Micromonospora sp. NPDC048999]